MKREIKPFKVSEEAIDEYQFTKKQIKAYEALEKAVKRCKDSGLSLFGKQWNLIAIPSKFHMNDMITNDYKESRKRIIAPTLEGAALSDSGADDTEYIKDEFIK